MRYISLILIFLVAFFATPAIAADLYQGQDFWGPENFFDIRTYHESHPECGNANNRGGWSVGIVFPESGNGPSIVDSVEIATGVSDEGAQHTIVYDSPMVYPWIGEMNHDYSIWFGHRMMMGDPITITPKDADGNLIDLHMGDGVTVLNSFVVEPSIDHALPPVPKIKHMAIKKSGELLVKFTAPYDVRNNHIRIRVYNAEGSGAEWQKRYYPPYQIEKKDGRILPDKMKVFLPAEFAGRIARIEYRVYEDDGYMSRGIVFFRLPELEE